LQQHLQSSGCLDTLALLDRLGTLVPLAVPPVLAVASGQARRMSRKYTLHLPKKALLTSLQSLLRHHVPLIDRRTVLHYRQLPVPTKDPYLGLEERKIPTGFPDLFECEDDYVV
jgi:hypothetical protein